MCTTTSSKRGYGRQSDRLEVPSRRGIRVVGRDEGEQVGQRKLHAIWTTGVVARQSIDCYLVMGTHALRVS